MLTASIQPEDRLSAADPEVLPADRPLRVLVVDDCADTADSLVALLTLWGHDVDTSYDGEAAVAAAVARRHEVIFLDLAMPKLCGCEVVRRLRCEPGVKNALIVAVTGYPDASHRRLAIEAGFDLYHVKPVDPESLHAMLVRMEAGKAGSPEPYFCC